MSASLIPASPPIDFAELIARERAELLDLLVEVADADWHRPSPCPGWSVLDLAVHLVGVAFGVLARDRDGHTGTPVPDEVSTEASFVSFIDEVNGLWVRAGRRLSPRLVVDLLRWTGPQLHDLYRRQDPSDVSALVSWASDEPVPRWLDQGRELTERWVHHQQIRHALGLPSRLDPHLTGVVLDVFSWAFPFRLAATRRPAGAGVEVEITGAVSRRWGYRSDGDRWTRSESPGAAEPVVRLTMDADTAWMLLSGGLSVDQHPVPQRNDDPELARVLVGTRAVIVAPPHVG